MRSCRKFCTDHLDEGGLKEKGRSYDVWSKNGSATSVGMKEKREKPCSLVTEPLWVCCSGFYCLPLIRTVVLNARAW